MRAQRIFLTGATGAMGCAIIAHLVNDGHTVTGTVRTDTGASLVSALGGTPVRVDLFDPVALVAAMAGSDVVAHFATRIPVGFAATRVRAWADNDRLRRETTTHLIAAATAAAIPRFIFESITLAYPDKGQTWIDETQALDPVSPVMHSALDAEALLADFVARGGEPLVLRFGRLYGAGRASADLIEGVRRRRLPVIGAGDNLVSSIHVDDVGRAVTAALSALPGVYNVVDDAPLTQREWMLCVATALDAPAPRTVPRRLARLALGHVARVLTVSHRISNQRFCAAANWQPAHPSARVGWPAVVGRAEPGTVAA